MTQKSNLVVFDLFGTLFRFGVHRHPFRKIFTWAKENGRRPRPDDARQLLTLNDTPEAVFKALGIYLPPELIVQFRADVSEELESITLYDDVESTLIKLTEAGARLAICSNLAQPYGAVIDKLLSEFDLIRCLSYQVGFIKPDDEIFRWLIAESCIPKENVLFVGDSLIADYEGPIDFGFKAFHLIRGGESNGQVIGSLADLMYG